MEVIKGTNNSAKIASEASDVKIRVLFSGHCAHISTLKQRLDKLQASSAGPFDVLFISSLSLTVLREAINASEPCIPLPGYFLVSSKEEEELAISFAEGSNVSTKTNLIYLGRTGRTDVGGLSVAFCGTPELSDDDFTSILGVGDDEKSSTTTHKIPTDVLITNYWPRGVLNGISVTSELSLYDKDNGHASIAKLVDRLEPRYIYCGGSKSSFPFYQRPAFVTRLGNSSRFISLANVSSSAAVVSPSEPKYLHALKLTPASMMTLNALLKECTPEASVSPYSNGQERRDNASGTISKPVVSGMLGKRTRVDGDISLNRNFDEGGGGRGGGGGGGFSAERAAQILSESPATGAPSGQFFYNIKGGGAGKQGGKSGEEVKVRGPSTTIFVGNVAHAATEADIRGLFRICGEIVSVRIAFDRETKKPRGFCHIEFSTLASSTSAVALNGVSFLGRQLSVSFGDGNNKNASTNQDSKANGGASSTLAGFQKAKGSGDVNPVALECWFCLASPHVEKHLVVSIGNEAYLALPKGGISDDHALIIPIAHHNNLATASPALKNEIALFMKGLTGLFASRSPPLYPLAFERVLRRGGRNDVPLHTHMQVIGLPFEAATRAAATFITEGQYKQIVFERLADDIKLEDAVKPEEGSSSSSISTCEYLFIESFAPSTSSGGQPLVHSRILHKVPAGAKHPVQFAREVVCRVLSKPERLEWKKCVTGTEKESEEASKFRDDFLPFDFTSDL